MNEYIEKHSIEIFEELCNEHINDSIEDIENKIKDSNKFQDSIDSFSNYISIAKGYLEMSEININLSK